MAVTRLRVSTFLAPRNAVTPRAGTRYQEGSVREGHSPGVAQPSYREPVTVTRREQILALHQGRQGQARWRLSMRHHREQNRPHARHTKMMYS